MRPGPRAGGRAGAAPGVRRRVRAWVHALVCRGPALRAPRGPVTRGADPRLAQRGRAGSCGAVRCGPVCVCAGGWGVCVRARASECVPGPASPRVTMLRALRPRGSLPDPSPPGDACSSPGPGQGAAPCSLSVAESALILPQPRRRPFQLRVQRRLGRWARRLRSSASGPSGHRTAAATTQRLCPPPVTFFLLLFFPFFL